MIERYRRPFMHVHRNLPRDTYAGLLNVADVMIGNSSSGIMEAPSFHLPVINIGLRQQGREQAGNVIDVEPEKDEIIGAVRKAMSREFREKASKCINPYGDGRASERIVKILKEVEINEELVCKRMSY